VRCELTDLLDLNSEVVIRISPARASSLDLGSSHWPNVLRVHVLDGPSYWEELFRPPADSFGINLGPSPRLALFTSRRNTAAASGIDCAKVKVRRLHGSLNWAIAAMEENICSTGCGWSSRRSAEIPEKVCKTP